MLICTLCTMSSLSQYRVKFYYIENYYIDHVLVVFFQQWLRLLKKRKKRKEKYKFVLGPQMTKALCTL